MKNVDVSKFDGKVVMVLLMGAVRAKRFCDGALLEFCKDGSIIKWLERLKGLDQSELVGCFNLIFYQSAEDAVFKTLGVE